jgi:hypothetical protein
MPGCFGTAEDDIWFKFTATDVRHRIWVSVGVNYSPVIEVFSGACGTLTSLGCFSTADLNPSTLHADLAGLSPGAVYYIRVYDKRAGSPTTDVRVCIIALPPPPSNDECSDAIALQVNSGTSCTNTYTGAQGYATESLAPCVATGYSALDVWYKFVATGTSHQIATNPLNYRDIMFQVYAGSCGTLSSLACSNSNNPGEQDVVTLTNLTPGATYYIRVYDRYANTSESQFTICINSNSTILPVRFVRMRAKRESGSVLISWNVAEEQSLSGYEVEKSLDGVIYTKIGFVDASSLSQYSFSDLSVLSLAYYRIKSVGLDGKFAYSMIIKVTKENSTIPLSVFPVPAQGEVWIEHPTANKGSFINLVSMSGKIVVRIAVHPGTQQSKMQLTSLSAGVYSLQFDDGKGNVQMTKMIKN